MHEWELKYLSQYTPCQNMNNNELAEAIGKVHVELIIVHPFREGNGRVARLLANLMALQAGKDIFNYNLISRIAHPEGYENYIKGIHESVVGNYDRIKSIFFALLDEQAQV
jgi:cell filamentation protein